MDVLTACRLSRFNQAGWEDKWGNLFFAEYQISWGGIVYKIFRNSKGKPKNMNSLAIEKSVGKWKPIAPRE